MKLLITASAVSIDSVLRSLKTTQFKKLPTEFKQALLQRWNEHYDISGEEAEVKNAKVQYGEVPTQKFIELLKTYPFYKEDFDKFEDWLEWRLSDVDVPDHGNSRWPCILTKWKEEPIEDGWHRLSYYLKSQAKTIPVVYCIDHIKMD